MKEYDLHVPLNYNDGSPVEADKHDCLQQLLADQFNGLTILAQPNRGIWRMAGVTYRDDIVIYRVLTPKAQAARRFFARLKKQLKQDLRQEEILIVERDVKAL